MYGMFQLELIWPLLSRGLWSGVKFPIWLLPPSFDHNSCKSNLNEQCEGTLSIYTLRPFQWCPRGPIWCLFAFSTKVLNIRNSCISATSKMGVDLQVIGLYPLHSPPFLKVCFTPKHTPLASWALALHT
jgi:hypothetical protein